MTNRDPNAQANLLSHVGVYHRETKFSRTEIDIRQSSHPEYVDRFLNELIYLLFFIGAIQQSIQLPRLTTKQAVTTEFFIFYVFILFYQFLCETKVPYGHPPLEMHLLCAGTSFRPYANRVCIMIMGCGHSLPARSSWAQWSRHSIHRHLLHPRP